MAGWIAGAPVPGQDDRHTRTHLNHPLGLPGIERRSGRDRRRGERRCEWRADSPGRRSGEDRREGHWRCQAGRRPERRDTDPG